MLRERKNLAMRRQRSFSLEFKRQVVEECPFSTEHILA